MRGDRCIKFWCRRCRQYIRGRAFVGTGYDMYPDHVLVNHWCKAPHILATNYVRRPRLHRMLVQELEEYVGRPRQRAVRSGVVS